MSGSMNKGLDMRGIARRVVGRVMAERGNRNPERLAGIHVDVRPGGVRPRPSDVEGVDDGGCCSSPANKARPGRNLVTARCLRDVPDGGRFDVPPGSIITDLAREDAWRRGIRLDGSGSGGGGSLRIAVGADHGGFELKTAVLDWVREAGHVPVDLGTHDENAVDYPDFARAVAEAVANGRCDIGVCVDGAGIGSAMAANKVPGVRAANCFDTKSAHNAREHNYANVLTLGGRSLDAATAQAVLRTFLATPLGAERHGRRVEKITAIEQRYAGPAHVGDST